MLLAILLLAIPLLLWQLLPPRQAESGFSRRTLPQRVDALLPQTQCGCCGYPGCRPYAEAITRGQAAINQCPPGGAHTITALAELLGEEPLPLNPAYGREQAPQLARIDEPRCIGCTKCIQACPVDAIIGAARQMHTVIDSLCTGCGLCLPPCPVDCIDLLEYEPDSGTWQHVVSHDEVA